MYSHGNASLVNSASSKSKSNTKQNKLHYKMKKLPLRLNVIAAFSKKFVGSVNGAVNQKDVFR